MRKKSILLRVPVIVLCLLATSANLARAAGTAPPEAEKTLNKLIEAIKAESYEAFLTDADANLKKQLSRQQFEGMCGLYAKPLKKGYTLEYFGQLKQRGMTVYVWKASAAGAQEDVIVKLAMKDGKVSGVGVF